MREKWILYKKIFNFLLFEFAWLAKVENKYLSLFDSIRYYCINVLLLVILFWRSIKGVYNTYKKNRAKKHKLRAKNPEDQRNGKIKSPHAHGKMVCPHVEVFFCHAVELGFVFVPGFSPKHKGNVRVEPERRGKTEKSQKKVQQHGENFKGKHVRGH